MKLKLFCTFVLLGAILANASGKTDSTGKSHHVKAKFYIAPSIGCAIPLGEFANTGALDMQAGFAKLGISRALETGVHFNHSRFDFALSIGRNTNRIDYNYTTSASGYYKWGWNNPGQYKFTTIMAGFCYTIPFEKFSVDIKFFAGNCNMRMSSLQTNIYTETNDGLSSYGRIISNSYPASSNNCIAIKESIALAYQIGSKVSVFFQSVFFQSNPDIPSVNGQDNKWYSWGTGAASGVQYLVVNHSETYSLINQPISLFELNVGIGYVF